MDEELHRSINDYVAEEHRLRQAHSDGSGVSPQEQRRLAELEVLLDRAWDLLRQRGARREAGADPAGARERSAGVVENYLN